MMRFHTQTGGSTLTAQQPDNNIIRTTMQALAAVLGGTQSLHTNSRDEAYATPSQDAVTIALRTQQILGYENGVADTIDPLAGSYYVEKLTDTIESEAKEYIAKIDKIGGALHAIEQGFQQREISDSAYRYQKSVENGERVVVGVNKFQSAYAKLPLLRVDPAVAKKQVAKLQKVKAERDNAAVKKTLENLKNVAKGTDNTMPAIVECTAVYATIGEICDVLRGVFGEQREFSAF